MNTLSKQKEKYKEKYKETFRERQKERQKQRLSELEREKQKQKSREKFTHQRNKTFFKSNDQKSTKDFTNAQKQNEEEKKRIKTEKDDDIQKIQIKWEKKKKNPYDLSNQQAQTFGDRFPDGFEKVKLLGRGGFSLVWLGEHKKSKKKYAVKQIITESTHQTHIKEIWFGTYFFEFGGAVKKQFADCPGVKNLVKLYYYFINKKDTWLLYQKCGDSLGNCLYELKSENYNGEKVYRIYYKELYLMLKNDQNLLRKIILEVAKALELLAENNIVHSDLKTENILVKVKTAIQEDSKTVEAKTSARLRSKPSQQQFSEANYKQTNPKGNFFSSNSLIEQVRLIDYGSSFVFDNLRQFSMATPQYMAPQILNFILYQNQLQYIPKLFEYVQDSNEPYVIDIWSLGSVILQIISGIPLWMSLKTIVKKKGKQMIRYGLFAVKGRTFDKIIKKQLQVIQNIQKYLQEQNYSEIVIEDDIKYLLKRMLALNPKKRISPTEIIEFLTRTQQDHEEKDMSDGYADSMDEKQ